MCENKPCKNKSDRNRKKTCNINIDDYADIKPIIK